mmetsp:Transcript_7135/g.9263  ORF Transcript_7135/g.9263 Transcript_7135/m.9263 type:complete len:223 (-) Transcript_7135:781-1449(-)
MGCFILVTIRTPASIICSSSGIPSMALSLLSNVGQNATILPPTFNRGVPLFRSSLIHRNNSTIGPGSLSWFNFSRNPYGGSHTIKSNGLFDTQFRAISLISLFDESPRIRPRSLGNPLELKSSCTREKSTYIERSTPTTLQEDSILAAAKSVEQEPAKGSKTLKFLLSIPMFTIEKETKGRRGVEVTHNLNFGDKLFIILDAPSDSFLVKTYFFLLSIPVNM